MHYLTVFIPDANSERSFLADMTEYLRTETLHRGVEAIILDQKTDIFIPNFKRIISELQKSYGSTLTLIETTYSSDRFIAINHYSINDQQQHFLISYPACDPDTGEINIIARETQAIFLAETVAAKYIDEHEPCIINYIEHPSAVSIAIQQLSQPTLNGYLKLMKGIKMRAISALQQQDDMPTKVIDQVLGCVHYIASCTDKKLAEKHLDERPDVKFILRPSSQKRDAADLVFTLSYRTEAKGYLHRRFLIEGNALFSDLSGRIVPVNWIDFGLENVLQDIMAKATGDVCAIRSTVKQRSSMVTLSAEKPSATGSALHPSKSMPVMNPIVGGRFFTDSIIPPASIPSGPSIPVADDHISNIQSTFV